MRTGVTRYGSGDILAVLALTKDGRRISVEITIVKLHGNDGKISETAAILRDVTTRFQKLRSLCRRATKLSSA